MPSGSCPDRIPAFVEHPVLTRLFRDARACELYADRDEAFAVIERHVSVLGRSWMICRVEQALVVRREPSARHHRASRET
jgi:hypothetical protein